MEGFSYNKNSLLEKYDSVPTTSSDKLVDSGDIKSYVDQEVASGVQLVSSEIDSLSADVSLTSSKVDNMIDRVGNPFVFKGTVAALSNLPSSGNTVNDTYFVEAEGFMYTWDGTSFSKSSTDVNNQLANDIATAYSGTKADYKQGDIVMYNNQVYVRKNDASTAEGTFVSSNWNAMSLGDEVTDLRSAIDYKDYLLETYGYVKSFSMERFTSDATNVVSYDGYALTIAANSGNDNRNESLLYKFKLVAGKKYAIVADAVSTINVKLQVFAPVGRVMLYNSYFTTNDSSEIVLTPSVTAEYTLKLLNQTANQVTINNFDVVDYNEWRKSNERVLYVDFLSGYTDSQNINHALYHASYHNFDKVYISFKSGGYTLTETLKMYSNTELITERNTEFTLDDNVNSEMISNAHFL